MQARHRIPTIFNLSMVDVLCCALGCVILLWLVYFKEARERSVNAGQINKELVATKLKLDGILVELNSTQQNLSTGKQQNQYLSGQLLEITMQRDQILAKWEKTDLDHLAALQKLKAAHAAIAGLRNDAKNLEAQDAATKAMLAQKLKDFGELASKYLGAGQTVRDLETKLNDQKSMLAINATQAAELKSKIAEAEQNAKNLEQQLLASKTLSKDYGEQLAKIESKAMKLEGELGQRNLDLVESSKRYDDLLQLKMLVEQSLTATKGDLAKSDKALALTKGNLAKSDQELILTKNDLIQLEAALALTKSDLAKRDQALALNKNDLAKNAQELALTQSALAKSGQALTLTKNDLLKLEAVLAETKLANHGLSGQAKVLSNQIDQLRAAADNRFAGIEMTGSRVVFLVDMSGSMRMKDYYLEDPNKWPLVCEILGKLIQSIPDLKQFQVILFSDKIRYPLANAGKWHDYSGPSSIKKIIQAVRNEVPENETNMSVVFDEAFKYRALGMDTIYLLSDGLPNAGDGLPPGAEKLPESDRSNILGKYIRDKLKTTWNAPNGRWVKERVRINTVGFYFDSPDVGAFLWALARDNDGGFVGLSKP